MGTDREPSIYAKKNCCLKNLNAKIFGRVCEHFFHHILFVLSKRGWETLSMVRVYLKNDGVFISCVDK